MTHVVEDGKDHPSRRLAGTLQCHGQASVGDLVHCHCLGQTAPLHIDEATFMERHGEIVGRHGSHNAHIRDSISVSTKEKREELKA